MEKQESVIVWAGLEMWRAIVSINEKGEKRVIAALSMPGASINKDFF